MATYNLGATVAPAVVPGSFPWAGSDKVGVMEIAVDLSKRPPGVPAAGYVTGDVLQLADFPRGAQLLGGTIEGVVIEGAALTVGVAITGAPGLAVVTAAARLQPALVCDVDGVPDRQRRRRHTDAR